MASPKLYGPLHLTEDSISAHVQAESPGVYALGHVRAALFIVSYVGRDDADLRMRLKTHLTGPYQYFKFAYALSPRDAFLKQCELYHDYVGLDNERHPPSPRGMELACRRCATAEVNRSGENLG